MSTQDSTAIVPFNYSGSDVRSLTIDGDPWFIAADSLALLELNRSSLTALDDDEKGVHTMDTLGGVQSVGIISEAGFYSLILRSRKPEAKQIRRWLTHEVLPTIRKTGSYSTATALTDDELIHRALEASARRIATLAGENKMLTARIDRDAPLVAKAEAHSASDNSAVNRQTFAREVQAWGIKQNVTITHEQVYEMLRRKGMLVDGERADRNHATSQAVKSAWAWTHKGTTDNGRAFFTTYLYARGQDIAWKWITSYVKEHGHLRMPFRIGGAA